MTASADNTVIYYDHWENGFSSGAAGDEVVSLNKGKTIKFESSNDFQPLPVDGDVLRRRRPDLRLRKSAAALVVSTWPEATGTVFTDAWEVYPVQAWENQYTVPVGENLGVGTNAYDDFDKTWILVMSGTDGNAVQIKAPNGTVLASNTLAKGGNSRCRGGSIRDFCFTSSAPVQVQIIAGQPTSTYEMRGLTVTPAVLGDGCSTLAHRLAHSNDRVHHLYP